MNPDHAPSVGFGIVLVLGGLCVLILSIVSFARPLFGAGVSLLIGSLLLLRRGTLELKRWMNA